MKPIAPGNQAREAGETAGCMLIFSWIASIIAVVLFILSALSNIGLLVWNSPSLPILIFFFGGYSIVVSFTGAFMMFTESYDMPCCTSSIWECLCSVCAPPTPHYLQVTKKIHRIEYRSTIQITGLTVLLTQMCTCAIMGIVTIIACFVRATQEVALETLGERWNLLHSSQAGYAILSQNQMQYECCGFTDDNDAPAQPCATDKAGAPLPGCGAALVQANSEGMQQLGVSSGFILFFLCLAIYYTNKARNQKLNNIKEWKKKSGLQDEKTFCL
jgi:hypothetical protein